MRTDRNEAGAIDTFVLSVPPEWRELPVTAALLDEVAQAGGDATVEDRRRLLVLRRLSQQAAVGGVVFAAIGSQRIDDEDDYHLTTIAWMVTRRASDIGLERIEFAQLQAAVNEEPVDPIRRVERPRLVDLPAGPSIRDLTVTSALASDGSALEVLECRYHMLIGNGEGMAVLAFASLNTELADELLGLFDDVASSLELVAA